MNPIYYVIIVCKRRIIQLSALQDNVTEEAGILTAKNDIKGSQKTHKLGKEDPGPDTVTRGRRHWSPHLRMALLF